MIRLKHITIYITITLLSIYCNPRTKVKESIINKNNLIYEDKITYKKTISKNDKPKTISKNDKPKTISKDNKPKTISKDNKPKTISKDNKPKTISKDNKPKTISKDNKPKTISKDNKPKTISKDDKSKTISKDDKPKVIPKDKNLFKIKSRKELLKELYKKYKQDFKKQNVLLNKNTLMTDKEEKEFNEKLKTINKNGNITKHNLLGCSIETPKSFEIVSNSIALWQLLYNKDETNIKILIGISEEKNVQIDKLLEQLKNKYKQLANIKWSNHSQIKKNQLKKHNATTGLYTKTSYITTKFNVNIYITILQHKSKTALITVVLSTTSNNKKKDKELKPLKTMINKILQSFIFL